MSETQQTALNRLIKRQKQMKKSRSLKQNGSKKANETLFKLESQNLDTKQYITTIIEEIKNNHEQCLKNIGEVNNLNKTICTQEIQQQIDFFNEYLCEIIKYMATKKQITVTKDWLEYGQKIEEGAKKKRKELGITEEKAQ